MNWLDAPLLVYGAVRGHPAEGLLEEELREGAWASSMLVLAELYLVLVRHYGVDLDVAAAEVASATSLPIVWMPVEPADLVLAAANQARFGLDTADAALLTLAHHDRGTLVTSDRRLLRVAQDEGVAARSAIPRTLEHAIAVWEERHLPPKGTRRVLAAVERWLRRRDARLAGDFVGATAQLTRPPA